MFFGLGRIVVRVVVVVVCDQSGFFSSLPPNAAPPTAGAVRVEAGAPAPTKPSFSFQSGACCLDCPGGTVLGPILPDLAFSAIAASRRERRRRLKQHQRSAASKRAAKIAPITMPAMAPADSPDL